MIKPSQLIKRWWNFVQSAFDFFEVDPPESLKEDEKQPLPTDLTTKISIAVSSLLPPSGHVDAVLDTLGETMKRWDDYDAMPNMLVVLTDPVQSTDRLMVAVAQRLERQDSGFPDLRTYRLDEWLERPVDYGKIDREVRDAIAAILVANRAKSAKDDVEKRSGPHCDDGLASDDDTGTPSVQASVTGATDETQTPIRVIVIPALERYFLRCIDGLEAIETIRQIVVDHPEYFWLIGCNSWAWSYLDKVCYLSAYLDCSWSLPTLNARDLHQWLLPLEEVVELSPFPKEPIDRSKTASDSSEWLSPKARKYFSKIEEESGGIATVAAAVWQYSLRYEFSDPESHQSANSTGDLDRLGHAVRGDITLPDVPSLTDDDRYLLYAILLHGSLSSQHLAVSLADPQGMVRAQIQSLSRQELIVRTRRCWSINPVYYPSLSRDLRRNNFLVT